MPGVGHAQDLGDRALPVDHQPVDLPEDVADLAQVIFGGQPGPWDQPVVVGAALAINEHELDGGGGGELAQQVGHQHGLAEPGQPGYDHAGDLSRADHDHSAVLGPPQPPAVQGSGGHAGQVDPGRRQQRVAVQAPEPDPAWSLLLGPDADTAPGVGQ